MMKQNHYNPLIHHRHSIRLQGFDYSKAGFYYITMCVQKRECLLGKIFAGKMHLNEYGQTTEKCWLEIPQHYPNCILHEFVVMPNHLHGIIELTQNSVGAQDFVPQPPKKNEFQKIIPRSVGAIIRGFKIGTTKQWGASIWQRNYWEHIIRNEKSYQRIEKYIINNIANWEKDRFYLW